MLSEKERTIARNEAIKALNISCGRCYGIMRKMGEWPVQINDETKHFVQAAKWVCPNCKYPSPSKNGVIYQAMYTVFIPLE